MSDLPIPQLAGDLLEHRLVDRAGPEQRRRGEAEQAVAAPDPHQAGAALLHDHAGLPRLAAGLQPRVAGAERRVPGEGQLGRRR